MGCAGKQAMLCGERKEEKTGAHRCISGVWVGVDAVTGDRAAATVQGLGSIEQYYV